MDQVCFNGDFLPAGAALFTAQNRGFRYGDGIFETIKFFQGRILLADLHFERLFLGLKMMQIISAFDAVHLSGAIAALCRKNNCMDLARVRLAVFRNHQNQAEYVIEAASLSDSANQWSENGLSIDVYPFARKNPDAFSNLKTANFLPYVLAGHFATESSLDDAVVLNSFSRVCDTSKANIFFIKNNEIFTPALHEGCISGVMRRFLVEALKGENYPVHQNEVPEQEMLAADEIFLTNSIYDLRWVRFFKNKEYPSRQSLSIYRQFIEPLYK
jgi:branched-chain amino acid aminotransferase